MPDGGRSPDRNPENNQSGGPDQKQRALRTELAAFSEQFTKSKDNIVQALPGHIEFEKFMRAAMIAVQREPDLLFTHRPTLFLELQKCAMDGLVPDGREAVIVIRWNKKLGGKVASYMPMVGGLRKLARQSGEISDFYAEVAFKDEPFRVVLGDSPKIEHERVGDCVKPDSINNIVAAYAVAILKDGTKHREVVYHPDLIKIRNTNEKWSSGPWAEGKWPAEMAKKSAIRRASKSLPRSEENAAFFRAVDRDLEYTDPDLNDETGDGDVPQSEDGTSQADAVEQAMTRKRDIDGKAEPGNPWLVPVTKNQRTGKVMSNPFAQELLAKLHDVKSSDDLREWLAANSDNIGNLLAPVDQQFLQDRIQDVRASFEKPKQEAERTNETAPEDKAGDAKPAEPTDEDKAWAEKLVRDKIDRAPSLAQMIQDTSAPNVKDRVAWFKDNRKDLYKFVRDAYTRKQRDFMPR